MSETLVIALVVPVSVIAAFSNTITLGSVIVGVLTGSAGLAVFGYGVKWKSAWQVASSQAEELRKALSDERERSDRCDATLREAHEREIEYRETIEKLSALPNLTKVIEVMAETSHRQDDHADRRLAAGMELVQTFVRKEFGVHDERAQERHEATVEALHAIAGTQTREG